VKRGVAAIARPEEVRDRELAELAQVRRQQEGHQAVAAGPAENEGQTVKALQVKTTSHADERGGRHPVRAGRHAVEDGRHTSPRHVVLGDVCRPAHDADAGIKRDGGKQEHVPDPHARQPELFQDRQNDQEHQEAARVVHVILLELVEKRSIRADLGAHQSSPSATPYSSSSRFMARA
jgi:hypothetical protein